MNSRQQVQQYITQTLNQALHAFQQQEWQQSLKLVDTLLMRAPQHVEALNLKATLKATLRQTDEAEQIWQQIIRLQPGHVFTHSNLGRLYQKNKNYEQAVHHLQKAIELNPVHANSHLNLGVVYIEMGEYEKAIATFEHALQLDPALAQAKFNIGNTLQKMGRLEESFEAYRQALQINPHHLESLFNLVFTYHYSTRYNAAESLKRTLELGRILDQIPRLSPMSHPANKPYGAPLRIGFVSADLKQHPVGYFLLNAITHLQHYPVELVAYSNGTYEDHLSARLKAVFKEWHPIVDLSDRAAAELIRQHNIDILVDLSGHTAGSRLQVFAAKPAPVQLSWIGYFSTTGLAAMDYIIGDPFALPPQDEKYYSEKVLRMPASRFCFVPPDADDAALAAPTQPPVFNNGYLTFGCYQTLSKVNSQVIQAWHDILRVLPSARLRLQSTGLEKPEERQRVTDAICQGVIDPARITTLPPSSRAEYLQSYADVDLLLDTFPYPGGTTTTEALWMGLPTLCLEGEGLFGRQGAALHRMLGLEPWICESQQEYVQRAIALGQNLEQTMAQLHELRQHTVKDIRRSALFDGKQFAKDLYLLLHQAFIQAARIATPA